MRVAIAGVGHWHAPLHLDALRWAGARPAMVWDPAPDVAARFAAREGVLLASSLAELLADAPDMVVLVGHPADVPQHFRHCLGAGIPIVLDKPAAPNTEELAAMAPGADRFVAVPFGNRCSPIWAEMARLRTEGRLGRIAHAAFRLINGPPARYRADGVDWVLDPAVSGGGALRNLGLHGADAAMMLFGADPPEIAGAVVSHATHHEAVDDYAAALLTRGDGPVVTVEAGYVHASMAPGGDFEWRVGAAGASFIDRGKTCTVTTLDDGITRALPPLSPHARYRAFMADTIARVQRGEAPLAGFGDYLAAMRLVDRIYQKAMT